MAGDLGGGSGEVHGTAAEVLTYWFATLGPEDHFAKDAAIDAAIRTRFGALRDHLVETAADGWRGDVDMLLAAVIAIDQFSRNLFRGSAEAYRADPIARELTLFALLRGWADELPAERRHFLLMPLLHAEDLALHELVRPWFEALGLPDALGYAREHAEVIARYGRYPSRNASLGRASTPAEEAYLSRPDAGW